MMTNIVDATNSAKAAVRFIAGATSEAELGSSSESDPACSLVWSVGISATHAVTGTRRAAAVRKNCKTQHSYRLQWLWCADQPLNCSVPTCERGRCQAWRGRELRTRLDG